MNISICGGNGFLGRELARFFLERGHAITILSRSKPDIIGIDHVFWKGIEDARKAIQSADVVINLAGKSVNCRYTKANKAAILASRVETTTHIKEVIKAMDVRPKVWLNASTATIYRHALDKPMTELKGDIGDDFSMGVAKAWEFTFFDEDLTDVRQVALRTSIVFGNTGGAYLPMKNLVKAGLGGKIGNGKQMVSWIHITDFCNAVQWIINHENLSGPVNVTAPNPLTNTEQMRIMRKTFGFPTGLPSPEWLLKIGAAIIGTEPELVLKSRWVLPEKLLNSGFEWQFEHFDSAISNLAQK